MEGIFRRLSRWCRNPKTFSRNCRSKAKKNALETSSLETWRSASNLWQMISFSPSFELLLLRLLVPVKTWHALVFAAFCTPSKSGTSTRVWHNWKICLLYSVDPSSTKNGHTAMNLLFHFSTKRHPRVTIKVHHFWRLVNLLMELWRKMVSNCHDFSLETTKWK